MESLITGCYWDSKHDAFGMKTSESRVNRVLDYFSVTLIIRYKHYEVWEKKVFFARVLPGRGIVVRSSVTVPVLDGGRGDGEQEF
ncbi:MAG: hypothetical protein ABGY09_00670 [Euryarchaeota archaeon]